MKKEFRYDQEQPAKPKPKPKPKPKINDILLNMTPNTA
jgi:hypothetical protein